LIGTYLVDWQPGKMILIVRSPSCQRVGVQPSGL